MKEIEFEKDNKKYWNSVEERAEKVRELKQQNEAQINLADNSGKGAGSSPPGSTENKKDK